MSSFRTRAAATLVAACMILPQVTDAAHKRFDVTDLTVRDQETGLVWARHGNLARSMFEGAGSTPQQINALIMSLNDEGYGACENWHLPAKEELETLIEYAEQQGYGRGFAAAGRTVAQALREAGFRDIEDVPYWATVASRSRGADVYRQLVMTDGSFSDSTAGAGGVFPVCFSNGKNGTILAKGKAVFQEQCAACHDYTPARSATPGKGTMGAMETRKCKFGKNYSKVINGIRNGTSNGMPSYRDVLPTDAIHAVTIYVLTLRCGQGQVF